MSDNTKKAQCIHCFHFFSKDSNSTLKNHISHPHCEALKRVSELEQSSMYRDESIFVYNPDVLREQFASLVIHRGLPFNHFDDEQTTMVFQKHLQPKYNHVGRTTLKRDAIKLWVTAKQTIIDGFANLNTNVNLRTDVWSAPHGVSGSYICVIAYWIEPCTWQMMKWVIAFEDFLVPHTASALARTLIKIVTHRVDKYGLEKNGSTTLWKARNDPSLFSEYERYVNSDFVTLLDNNAFATFHLLGFWKANESMFPVLSRIAMDIISVQANSVASESAFSTSGRVLSIRRTRLTPTSLEMCMCLKDHLDAQERKQHKSGLENPIDFEEEILDADVQQNEAIPLSEEEI
nr:zinc finger BED domain-containing protein RICESLEEPER 2-like [Tanacetum cinerariifolium]